MSDEGGSAAANITNRRVFVAGHRGMVGAALVRRLRAAGCANLLLAGRDELDLEDQQQVGDFLQATSPELIFLAAAKVGGIHANDTYPAEFIYTNLMIAANVIHAAWRSGVRRLVFLGSSCIYPRLAPQPMPEECLLTGPLEPTNEPYAIAKIAGIKLCESYNRQYATDFRSVMPTNLYGPGDNFDLENSHVLPALLRRFHDARSNDEPSVEVWGSGRPRREFLHVDDLADACLCIAGLAKDQYAAVTGTRRSFLNVGVGNDISIAELAGLIARVVGFDGEIVFNPRKPDGAPRKLLDVSRLEKLGWRARVGLEEGVAATYSWYLDNLA